MQVTFELKEGYLYVIAEGDFNLPDAHKFLTPCLELIQKHGLTKAVADITRISGLDTNQAPIISRFEMSDTVVKALPVGFKLAILQTEQQSRDGRFGETVIVNRGGIARMTTSLEEALEWLGVGDR